MAAARRLRADGIAAMLDHLGEEVASAAQAAAATDGYIRALKRIRESSELDCNISVKLTQLGLQISTGLCMENMEHVLQVAAEADPPTLVMIDMEASEYVDRTLRVYLSLRGRFPAVGLAIQSYLHRTLDDVRTIAGPTPVVDVAVLGRQGTIVWAEQPPVAGRSDRRFEGRGTEMFAGHERRHVLEHRHVDRLAAAGLLASVQREADALGGDQATGVIAHDHRHETWFAGSATGGPVTGW